MARHPVAANLLMLFMLVSGLLSMSTIRQQTFPDATLDVVEVRVDYRGASPEEIERSIVRRIEERIESVDGVKEVTSVASEGVGRVTIELKRGTSVDRKLAEIETEVSRIDTFPDEAEEPIVNVVSNRSRVLEILIAGDTDERTLKELANRAKDDLTQSRAISFVKVASVRDYEISIEVSRDTLRAYDLTLSDIATAVRRESLDLPGGSIETSDESILLRTMGQNYGQDDFENIVVLTNDNGSQLKLGQIAQVKDGFESRDLVSRFDGKPVAIVKVYRVGDEQVMEVVAEVERYLAENFRPRLPSGIIAKVWRDDSRELKGRLALMKRNGAIGFALVLIALALFLDLGLAFWVSVGIGISFVGTFAVMSVLGVTLNGMSAFGFLVAIGIVVDDAIVVGENIHSSRLGGLSPSTAAVRGAQRISSPVIFAIATTIAAFYPLLLMPGMLGKFLSDIPFVVIIVLVLSLIESLLILPRHLSHHGERVWKENAITRVIHRIQASLAARMEHFVAGPLDRVLHFVTERWGVTLAGGAGILLITFAVLAGGYVKIGFFPEIDGEYVTANIETKQGSATALTLAVAEQFEAAARAVAAELVAEFGIDSSPVEAIYLVAGAQSMSAGPSGSASALDQAHKSSVVVQLMAPEIRPFSAEFFEKRWRKAVRNVAGFQKASFNSGLISAGEAVQVELTADSDQELRHAIDVLTNELNSLRGVFDVRDDQEQGRRELQIYMKPAARSYGLTLESIASQIRAGFFGAEAQRVQRGKEEVRVYVRLPEAQRRSPMDLEDYRIRTPDGGFVPLARVARVEESFSPATINRRDGRRVVRLTADVDRSVITSQQANGKLANEVLPALREQVPSLVYEFGGEQREQGDTLPVLARNFLLALIAIYILLAIPFRTYSQPLIVMSAIPFGITGAVLGHAMMGINITLASITGIVGLSGVIINGALVLIDFANEERRAGKAWRQSLIDAAKSRFRPIFLTALTTFLGISPMIFERSFQGQFLVPLAVSIGFGVLFGTFILMLLVPALAMALHRLRPGSA